MHLDAPKVPLFTNKYKQQRVVLPSYSGTIIQPINNKYNFHVINKITKNVTT